MRSTAELFQIPPTEANAMSIPPVGTPEKRPMWDICWRAKTALILMAIGALLQGAVLVLLLSHP